MSAKVKAMASPEGPTKASKESIGSASSKVKGVNQKPAGETTYVLIYWRDYKQNWVR